MRFSTTEFVRALKSASGDAEYVRDSWYSMPVLVGFIPVTSLLMQASSDRPDRPNDARLNMSRHADVRVFEQRPLNLQAAFWRRDRSSREKSIRKNSVAAILSNRRHAGCDHR